MSGFCVSFDGGLNKPDGAAVTSSESADRDTGQCPRGTGEFLEFFGDVAYAHGAMMWRTVCVALLNEEILGGSQILQIRLLQMRARKKNRVNPAIFTLHRLTVGAAGLEEKNHPEVR
jgi:hypothetical protein